MLCGCGLFPEVKDETAGWSADRLYQTAHEAMLQGNYMRATKLFDQLEARFPYGRYAQQAILESAFANWRANEQAAAIAAADRFIRTYPNHPNVDYAYYLKGLVHFREDQGLIGYVYELDLSERDPKEMRCSFAAFKELTAKFPDSQYYQDSIARMRYLNNAMATYEVNVASYYYKRGAYVAAANRAQGALLNFPQTPANEKALDILRASYTKLGMTQLADDSQQILAQDVSGKPLHHRRDRHAVVAVLAEGRGAVRRAGDRPDGAAGRGGSSGTDRTIACRGAREPDGREPLENLGRRAPDEKLVSGKSRAEPDDLLAESATSIRAGRRRHRSPRACASSAAATARCAGRKACRSGADRRSRARRDRSPCE